VEFVQESDVKDLFDDYGIEPQESEGELVRLVMASDEAVRMHVTTPDADVTPDNGAQVITVDAERLPTAVEGIIHKLHLNQVLLIPVSKWRSVFDAVAFSLAENEDWQEIDATATVELNGRDPLLCEPGDFQTVVALMRALLQDAENPDQALMLTTPTAPLLVEIVPDGAIRISLGNQAMADEISETLAT
jgi:hypothetical protein